MFKKLGLTSLLLFSGSAQALLMIDSNTMLQIDAVLGDDEVAYHQFHTDGSDFSIDLYQFPDPVRDPITGQPTGEFRYWGDTEIWILTDGGFPNTGLTGDPAGPGSEPPFFDDGSGDNEYVQTPGYYWDSPRFGPCNARSSDPSPDLAPFGSYDDDNNVEYIFDECIDLSLSEGIYWLAIGVAEFSLEMARNGNTPGGPDLEWNGGDYRLTITGRGDVPEPSVIGLFAIGLVSFAYSRRRKFLTASVKEDIH